MGARGLAREAGETSVLCVFGSQSRADSECVEHCGLPSLLPSCAPATGQLQRELMEEKRSVGGEFGSSSHESSCHCAGLTFSVRSSDHCCSSALAMSSQRDRRGSTSASGAYHPHRPSNAGYQPPQLITANAGSPMEGRSESEKGDNSRDKASDGYSG
jgi:hypothetical protein